MRNQKADKQERYSSSVRVVVVLATSQSPPTLKSCEKGALSVTEVHRMRGWLCCPCMSVAELVAEYPCLALWLEGTMCLIHRL